MKQRQVGSIAILTPHGYLTGGEETDELAHSNFVRRGGQMKLCSVDKRIENIFVITKLSLVFDVYATEEQAIASFAEKE